MDPNLDVYIMAAGAGCLGMLVGWIFANCVPLNHGGTVTNGGRGRHPRGRVVRIDVAGARVRRHRREVAFQHGSGLSGSSQRCAALRERVRHFFHRAGDHRYLWA